MVAASCCGELPARLLSTRLDAAAAATGLALAALVPEHLVVSRRTAQTAFALSA